MARLAFQLQLQEFQFRAILQKSVQLTSQGQFSSGIVINHKPAYKLTQLLVLLDFSHNS